MGPQHRSRLARILNVPPRVRLRFVRRLRPCWMARLSIRFQLEKLTSWAPAALLDNLVGHLLPTVRKCGLYRMTRLSMITL